MSKNLNSIIFIRHYLNQLSIQINNNKNNMIQVISSENDKINMYKILNFKFDNMPFMTHNDLNKNNIEKHNFACHKTFNEFNKLIKLYNLNIKIKNDCNNSNNPGIYI